MGAPQRTLHNAPRHACMLTVSFQVCFEGALFTPAWLARDTQLIGILFSWMAGWDRPWEYMRGDMPHASLNGHAT